MRQRIGLGVLRLGLGFLGALLVLIGMIGLVGLFRLLGMTLDPSLIGRSMAIVFGYICGIIALIWIVGRSLWFLHQRLAPHSPPDRIDLVAR